MNKDCIVSQNPENGYLTIENSMLQDQEYLYKAQIAEDRLSAEVKKTICEYWECVDTFSLTLLDDIEETIKSYDFKLQRANIKVFNIEIIGKYVTYYVKYPSSTGYLNEYPNTPICLPNK